LWRFSLNRINFVVKCDMKRNFVGTLLACACLPGLAGADTLNFDGDYSLQGKLLGLSWEGVVLEYKDACKPLNIKLERVASLQLDAVDEQQEGQAAMTHLVVLNDDQSIPCNIEKIAEGKLQAKNAHFGSFTLPMSDVKFLGVDKSADGKRIKGFIDNKWITSGDGERWKLSEDNKMLKITGQGTFARKLFDGTKITMRCRVQAENGGLMRIYLGSSATGLGRAVERYIININQGGLEVVRETNAPSRYINLGNLQFDGEKANKWRMNNKSDFELEIKLDLQKKTVSVSYDGQDARVFEDNISNPVSPGVVMFYSSGLRGEVSNFSLSNGGSIVRSKEKPNARISATDRVVINENEVIEGKLLEISGSPLVASLQSEFQQEPIKIKFDELQSINLGGREFQGMDLSKGEPAIAAGKLELRGNVISVKQGKVEFKHDKLGTLVLPQNIVQFISLKKPEKEL